MERSGLTTHKPRWETGRHFLCSFCVMRKSKAKNFCGVKGTTMQTGISSCHRSYLSFTFFLAASKNACTMYRSLHAGPLHSRPANLALSKPSREALQGPRFPRVFMRCLLHSFAVMYHAALLQATMGTCYNLRLAFMSPFDCQCTSGEHILSVIFLQLGPAALWPE